MIKIPTDLTEEFDLLTEWEQNIVGYIVEEAGLEFGEALDIVSDGDYRTYEGCHDMEEVAEQIVDEQGLLNDIPTRLQYYFDHAAFGRDLAIEGSFHYVQGFGYVEVTR